MDTTSKMRGLHPNAEMSFIGYAIAAVILVGMLPLLPFFLLWLLVDRITGGREQQNY
ncbi:hypothetical protein ACFQMA_25265 [Halosimplex aquaticum]|uniref:Uncharacterized protein n=1 Tax=Halosimplex aquaticum TaxID=3026162 RepID=A0ABD5Y6S2_9EURY